MEIVRAELMIDRFDKNGVRLELGDVVIHDCGDIYTVVFADDILAYGLRGADGHFEFMSEWVAQEWEVM